MPAEQCKFTIKWQSKSSFLSAGETRQLDSKLQLESNESECLLSQCLIHILLKAKAGHSVSHSLLWPIVNISFINQICFRQAVHIALMHHISQPLIIWWWWSYQRSKLCDDHELGSTPLAHTHFCSWQVLLSCLMKLTVHSCAVFTRYVYVLPVHHSKLPSMPDCEIRYDWAL